MNILKNKKFFASYTWVYLAYNFYVILSGAYVRATNSGAGCGRHWPLCQGKVLPQLSRIHTIIEFTHRASSALLACGGICLLIWAFYISNKGDRVRKTAFWVVIGIILEALLGASLVLFSLVENNSSNLRAIMGALHLIITFMLTACITLTAHFSLNNELTNNKKKNYQKFIAIIALLCIGISGAITALSDTLFPPKYIGHNVLKDLSNTHYILHNLKVYHPIIAIIITIYLIFTCIHLTEKSAVKSQFFLSKTIIGILIIQLIIGMLNILLLTPLYLQLLHLFIANLLWVLFILFAQRAKH